jgi:hypothetical protein
MSKKYYYHVVYGEGFVDYFGSNVDTEYYWNFTPNKLLNEEGTQVVSFELNDLPLTKKFVEAYKNKVWATTYDYKIRGNHKAFEMISDVYRSLTKDWILESRTEMNDTINLLNAHPVAKELGYSFPEELKLNDINLNDMRIPSLNRLHELFELHMEHLSEYILHNKMDPNTHDLLWNKLQSINLLVHYNEKLDQNIARPEDIETAPAAYFTSLKFSVNKKTEWLLEPEDYEHFTAVRPTGGLQLDFGTVGKDLWHCANTNDIELVKDKMVSQQWELNPWVQYDWNECTEAEWEDGKKLYWDWVKDNNVADYYDITEPKFTPGRHQLGKCVSHNFTGPGDFVDQIISKTPSIKYFCITEDGADHDHIL